MYSTSMAQEEQHCSNSSGGGGGSRSSKKAKQKKIPQRGLGVAQLEKMRLEEQQKKASAACIVLQHHQQPAIPFPLPPPPPPSTDLPPIFKPSIPISGLDLYGPTAPTPPPFPHDINTHQPSFSPIWNSMDFNHNAASEGRKIEPMFTFRPLPTLHNDPNPLWHSSMQQRKQNHQQQPQPSSMVSQFPCFVFASAPLWMDGWNPDLNLPCGSHSGERFVVASVVVWSG